MPTPALPEDKLYNTTTLRRLALAATVMMAWLLVWALVLKLGSRIFLSRVQLHIGHMSIEERFMCAIVPFQYTGTEYQQTRQLIDSILNCFVFSPFAICLIYVFKKRNILRDVAICFLFSLCIEIVQLYTILGNFQLEDLLTNTIGCFIGYGIYHLLLKRLNLKQSVRLFIAIDAILVATTVFSIVTTAIASDLIYQILIKAL